MKFLISALLLSTSTIAFAADYSCYAKPNKNRTGYDIDWTIDIKPLATGGIVAWQVAGKTVYSTVKSITPYDKKTQRDYFDKAVGTVHEEDVSGVANIGIVDSVTIIEVDPTPFGSDEVRIYQLFSKGVQVGGTHYDSMKATACVPK